MKRKAAIVLLAAFFIIADVLVIPLLLQFPVYLNASPVEAAALWVDFVKSSPFAGPGTLKDPFIRRIWLYTQPMVLAGFLWVMWHPGMRKRRNNVGDGIGGPEAAEYSITHGSSRWQTKKEVEENTTSWKSNTLPLKGGVVLGYDHQRQRAWLETNDRHTLIIGATQSGKSRRLIFPTIWELGKAGESMVVTDPKGELYERSRDYLMSKGYNVTLLDFRNPRRGNYWNPLDPVIKAADLREISLASERAWDIAHMIVHQKPHIGDPLWPNGTESVIASLVLLAGLEAPKEGYRHLGTAYAILYELGAGGEDGTIPLNEYMTALPAGHLAKAAFGTALLAPYRTRASFFTGAAADLRLWADPSIAHLTCKQDHELEGPGIEKTAVFLVVPDEKSTRHILAALYIDQIYQALVDLATREGGRLPVRVNFILEEFGNMPAINDFDKKLTVAGGRGMRFTLVVQDIAQLKRHYKDSAQTITGNCHTWIYLLTADVETARLISAKTGQYTVETKSYSSSVRSTDTSTGSQYGTTGRGLLLPDEVLRWPKDRSLVIQSRQFPMKLPLPDLRKWPADKELTKGPPDAERVIKSPNVWVPEVSRQDKDKASEMKREVPEQDILYKI